MNDIIVSGAGIAEVNGTYSQEAPTSWRNTSNCAIDNNEANAEVNIYDENIGHYVYSAGYSPFRLDWWNLNLTWVVADNGVEPAPAVHLLNQTLEAEATISSFVYLRTKKS